jgi:hypothetical protein
MLTFSRLRCIIIGIEKTHSILTKIESYGGLTNECENRENQKIL